MLTPYIINNSEDLQNMQKKLSDLNKEKIALSLRMKKAFEKSAENKKELEEEVEEEVDIFDESM